MLGFSAVSWARSAGSCSVCSFHTQIDRYVRFYLERHSFLERIKPRLAVQRLFQQFYSKCDVVAAPNRAVGQKLVAKIGVPAEKIGYFPRGINTTLYTAEKRSDAFRRARLNASAATTIARPRASPEKGALLYADAAKAPSTAAARRARLRPAAAACARGRGRCRRVRRARRPSHARAERGRPGGTVAAAGGGRLAPTTRARARGSRSSATGRTARTWRRGCSGARPSSATSRARSPRRCERDIYFFPPHTEAFPNTMPRSGAPPHGSRPRIRSTASRRAGLGYPADEHADAAEFARGSRARRHERQARAIAGNARARAAARSARAEPSRYEGATKGSRRRRRPRPRRRGWRRARPSRRGSADATVASVDLRCLAVLVAPAQPAGVSACWLVGAAVVANAKT